ncbi:MAG: addiction module protein [Victivallaceae bacterium]|nr:addiction module protein [Victivallaceae bacterium]
MNSSIVAETLKYDVSERIVIVEDIWDSIANVPAALPVTEAQKQELDKRLTAYHANPNAGSPWEAVKQRIVAK